MLTRRTLLASAAASSLAVLAACSGAASRPDATPGPTPEPGTGGPGVRAADTREQLLAANEYGMVNFPDGHLTYQPVGEGTRMWIAAAVGGSGGSTVALDTTDLVGFRPAQVADGDAVLALSPVGGQVALDSDYCGPGSVFPSADGDSLWLLYHGENHTFAGVRNVGSPYYATVGLASSTDGGLTWARRGAVLTGQVPRDDRPAPRDVVGAGSPSAVVVGDLLYVMYLDWNVSSPDELHLARVPLASVDDPGAWQKWHEGSFSTPGAGGASTAVVRRPGDVAKTVSAGGASLSWNTELQRYLLVFQCADGFWSTTSADLTGWAEAERFLALDDPVLADATFVAYGTLLTPGAPSDQVTGRNSYLYCAITRAEDVNHSLWRIPVTVTG